MQEIWTNSLLPKALKSCPKSNKPPNLVTLVFRQIKVQCEAHFKMQLQPTGSVTNFTKFVRIGKK